MEIRQNLLTPIYLRKTWYFTTKELKNWVKVIKKETNLLSIEKLKELRHDSINELWNFIDLNNIQSIFNKNMKLDVSSK